jgi:hypothetical protein
MVNAWVVGLFLAGVVIAGGVAGIVLVSGGDEPGAPVPAGVTAAERAYLDAAGAVDPGLVVNEARALRRAEESCADMAAGLSGDALTARVVARMSGGDASIDAGQAAVLIEAMRAHICA